MEAQASPTLQESIVLGRGSFPEVFDKEGTMLYQRPSIDWKEEIATGKKFLCQCGTVCDIADCISVSWSTDPLDDGKVHVPIRLACMKCAVTHSVPMGKA